MQVHPDDDYAKMKEHGQLGKTEMWYVLDAANPGKYNGYKVYGADGCQITTEAAAEILAEIKKLDIFADIKTSDFEADMAWMVRI